MRLMPISKSDTVRVPTHFLFQNYSQMFMSVNRNQVVDPYVTKPWKQ